MASFIKQPTVERLGALMQQLYQGELEIARFQRPFVWTDDQRVDLLDSIMRGMPIGSVTIWRTATHKLNRQDSLDGLPLPPPAHVPPYRQYILDGLQRMTSLYGALAGALYATPPEPDPDARRAPIYVDLSIDLDEDARRFEIVTKAQTAEGRKRYEDRNPHMMPADVMLTSTKLVRFISKLLTTQSDDAEVLAARAERIAERFRDYDIAVIPMALEDLKQVTLAFARINTAGTQMTPLHMLHALTFLESESEQKQTPLLDRVDQLIQELGPDWEELSDSVILQLLRHRLGRDVYDNDIESLGEALRKEPEKLDEVFGLIKTTIAALREVGIPSANVLPYTLQFTLIAMTLDKLALQTLHSMQCERLWHWLTVTGMTEYFSGASSRKISQAKSHLAKLLTAPKLGPEVRVASPDMPDEPAPHKRFDWRKARSRAHVLWLIFESPSYYDYKLKFMALGRDVVRRTAGEMPVLDLERSELLSTPKLTPQQIVQEVSSYLAHHHDLWDASPDKLYIWWLSGGLQPWFENMMEDKSFIAEIHHASIREALKDGFTFDDYFDMSEDEQSVEMPGH